MISLASEVEGTILSFAASVVTVGIGYRKGFFSGKPDEKPLNPPTFLLVLIGFALYFIVGLCVPDLFLRFVSNFYSNAFMSRVAKITYLSFVMSALTLAALLFFIFWIHRPIRQTILHRHPLAIRKDVLFSLFACLISFPLVIFVCQLLEIIVYLIFHTLEIPPQLVILFLKMTLGNPLYFSLASITIIIFTPIIEETLFRGLFQTYLRRYFNAPSAILISSLCFSFFHYSNDQGVGNIPVIGSLFILAYFLGFVYERRGSLIAPIFLHAVFNAVNTANLYILGN